MSTVYSVTRLNNEIKELLDAVPGYRNLLVQGEISNYKAHSSGHHYMTLKDEGAAINAVMFRSDAMRLKFRLGKRHEGDRAGARSARFRAPDRCSCIFPRSYRTARAR